MANENPIQQAGIEAGSALAGAGIGLVAAGPPGALLGAIAPAAAKAALEWVRDIYSRRREENVAALIGLAAHEAGLEAQELVQRLDADPAKSETFMRTLKVAQDAANLSDLVALAQSLSRTACSGSEHEVHAEAAFVRAVDALDSGHILLLSAFTKTANENHLGDGSPNFDYPVPQLHDGQLSLVIPEYSDDAPSLAAQLQAHGLVAYRSAAGGFGGGGGGYWSITPLGRAFIERMQVVERFLSDHGPRPDNNAQNPA